MDVNDIEFTDAVFRIPKNTVALTLEIQTYEQGKLQTIKGEFGPADVREALDLFEKTVCGGYPMFELTDKGRAYLDELERQRGDE